MPARRPPPLFTPRFNVEEFLEGAGVAPRVLRHERKAKVFDQGESATSVLYIRDGGVKISVLSPQGKEAVLAILGPGEFFGEGCLAGQAQRLSAATTIVPSTILKIPKAEMLRVLEQQPALSKRFLEHMLHRQVRVESDLVDQLFNSSEKRLARALLLLAKYRETGPMETIPKMSQATLAEMIGTTRPRISFFMNRFRQAGHIKYNGGIAVSRSLVKVLLQE